MSLSPQSAPRPFRALLPLWIWLAMAGPLPAAAPVRLATRYLTAEIQSPGGTVASIENRLTSEVKSFRDVAFRLQTTLGEITPANCPLAETSRTSTSVAFACLSAGLKVTVSYRVESDAANALRKFISVTNETTGRAVLFDVVMFDWRIPGHYAPGAGSYAPEGITDILFHKSGLFYDHSINLFLRDGRGGLFAGVENPFFQARYNVNRKVYPSRVTIYYQPRWVLEPGQTFEGDAAFVGVYRSEGVFRVPPHAQFFGERERLKTEILDWGEVWAMQRYMASIMSSRTLSGDDFVPTEYSIVGDIGRLGDISARQARGEKLSAEEQALLKHFGCGPFHFDQNEAWYRLTPATAAIYRTAIDDAASLGHFRTLVVPNLMAGTKGWFESPEEKQHHAEIAAREDTWYTGGAYPVWQSVADYAKAHGIGMFNFEIAGGVTVHDHPEWRYVLADGTPASQFCYANQRFAAWHLSQIDQALSRHPISHWQWDEGWMDSLAYSIAGFIGDDAYCYATDHGHLPGNVRYQQFRNVMSTLRALSERHPDVRFVIISGLIPGMPWVMKYLNNDSHTGSMEYGGWGDRNIYFLPTFKSRRDSGIVWLAHGMSSGNESSGYGDWYTMLENPKSKAAWKNDWDHWMNWTGENIAYLANGRDLFDGPRSASALQGSANCAGDRGWLFLRNPGPSAVAAELPVNGWLGLEQGDRFELREVYPEGRRLGVWRRGSSLKIPVSPGVTLLLHVQAVSASPDERPVPDVDGLPVQKAFVSLDEMFTRLNARDFWPAPAMHDKDGKPF